MKTARDHSTGGRLRLDLPWWCRPSWFLLLVSVPALLLFANSDPSRSLSKAQLFYAPRDTVLGLIALAMLIVGALLGESDWVKRLLNPGHSRPGHALVSGSRFQDRLAEAFLSQRIDWILMAIFLVSHLIFLRGFFTNPSLITRVLGGNLELKASFKTIPGLTTWTQVSLLLATLRGLRWSGVLPGKVKLISTFHLVFFAVLLIRAILWSERLALIEGIVPFFLCALPKLIRMTASVQNS